MSILEWFPLLNASVLEQNQLSVNSYLLLAYLIVCVIIKKPSFMLAFFMSCMLFEMELFDKLSEASLYALTFSIYSYAIFVIPCNNKVTIACGIILALTIIFGVDAYFYGIKGIYGAHETVIYNNIERLALYAHIILISALTPYRRISNSLRRFIASIVYVKSNSAYIVIC